MIYYLDNQENHKGAINENFGRELLELFSLGVGMDGEDNYTQEDVMECARAFTGYGLAPNYPAFPYGRTPFYFRYDATDHDDGEKTSWERPETGTVRTSSRLSASSLLAPASSPGSCTTGFVADEPSVPNWMMTQPQDMEAINSWRRLTSTPATRYGPC